MHSTNLVRWSSTLLVVTAVSTTTGVSAFLVPSLQPSVCYGTRPGDIGWGHRCQTQHKLFVKKLPSSLPSLSRLCSSPENDNEVKLLPTKENVIASTTNEEEVQQQSKSDSKTNGTPSSQPAPTAKELMNAMGTTPRRIFLSLLSSTFIALIANFVGVTSALLGSIPEDLVEQTGLDGYYPRGGFKRFRSGEYGYTVLLPKEWVADTAVELAKATRRTKMLDYSMKKSGGGVIPDAAFGPPSRFNEKGVSQSDTNLSIVASTIPSSSSFNGKPTLQTMLGTPQNAAETLLRFSIAPPGSGRTATLIAACEETRGVSPSNVYQFEYDVEKDGTEGNSGTIATPRRAISVIAVRENTLITMTVVAPRKDWLDKSFDAKLRKVAESFKLTR